MYSAVQSLGIALTSHAVSENSSFPFVTLPHFELRVEESREISGAELIAFAPLVPNEERTRWEVYANRSQGWIEEGLEFRGLGDVSAGAISDRIYPFGELDLNFDRQDFYAPLWQTGATPTNATHIMMDLFSHPSFKRMLKDVREINHPLLSQVEDVEFLLRYSSEDAADGQPRSYILHPVMDSFMADAQIAGYLIAVLPWKVYFADVLADGADAVLVDVQDACGSQFTFSIEGRDAQAQETDDNRNGFNVEPQQASNFAEFAHYDGDVGDDFVQCEYELIVYPSTQFKSTGSDGKSLLWMFLVIIGFGLLVVAFSLYNWFVQKRQETVAQNAEHTNALLSSLFPKAVQQRMMREANKQSQKDKLNRKNGFGLAPKSQLKDFLDDDDPTESPGPGEILHKTKPIADLFPDTTVMFADIVGFTAWSSMREPSQVFTLLETIYHAFDEIAKRRRVFKVETVGDCYVAVAGLPEPRKDHHVVMARFSRDCLYTMGKLTKQLEVVLGPDTGDLGLRFGLHSGPVTAGVLRGERARFQLFGDTVNTTARVETTGQANKIHLSQDTAELLIASGKGHWVTLREQKVIAKGKGEMQTYWLDVKGDNGRSKSSDNSESTASPEMSRVTQARNSSDGEDTKRMSEKQLRLVDWNVDIMKRLLREIVARRDACELTPDSVSRIRLLEHTKLGKESGVLDEVEEIITLPKFNAKAAENQKDPDSFDLSEEVSKQLHEYVQTIAAMYRHNPFHNFEHASHVSMSVLKLLSRIVAPDLNFKHEGHVENTAKDLHDHTYGITSDPLTQFAVVLAALIHDVDHTGVPNQQLIKENASVAAVYNNKSVAEQNSVDLSWELLMQQEYKELRRALYTTESDFKRFRHLIVNSVMATDIMDKELSVARKARWNKAFDEAPNLEEMPVATNRKATIVIEHLIQASDVAHTMQHWHIYRKWNTRLFEEMYLAFKEGRADTDPSTNWFKGEIGFFDFYIIPLAKKLKECGVFGVSSDEYLNYAIKNRKEWEARGQEIVAEMVESVNSTKDGQMPKIDYAAVATPPRTKKSLKTFLENLVKEAEAAGPQGGVAEVVSKPMMNTSEQMSSQGLGLVFDEPSAEGHVDGETEGQVELIELEEEDGMNAKDAQDMVYDTPVMPRKKFAPAPSDFDSPVYDSTMETYGLAAKLAGSPSKQRRPPTFPPSHLLLQVESSSNTQGEFMKHVKSPVFEISPIVAPKPKVISPKRKASPTKIRAPPVRKSEEGPLFFL